MIGAPAVKERILSVPSLEWPDSARTREDWLAHIVKGSGGSADILAQRLAVVLRGPGRSRARRMLAAYTDDRMFSLDLVGAVLRQHTFVQKMVDLGWTSKAGAEETMLRHAQSRYHA